MKTLQDHYLDLLAAWGELPLDEEEVKNILSEMILNPNKSTVESFNQKNA